MLVEEARAKEDGLVVLERADGSLAAALVQLEAFERAEPRLAKELLVGHVNQANLSSHVYCARLVLFQLLEAAIETSQLERIDLQLIVLLVDQRQSLVARIQQSRRFVGIIVVPLIDEANL
mgnify:CR=1 FL=1